jgi:hypothetical protein
VAYSPLIPLAETIGRPLDEAMIIICITLSMLISLLISHIRSPILRKIINTSCGILITTYTYGCGIFLLVPYNMIGYVFMSFAPRKHAHYYVIFLSGFLLSISNIIEQIEGDTGYNVSTLAMITFVKQTMLAINYRDGMGDLESWNTTREKKYALKELPSFFEYCNYVFPLQSSVIGPSFEFKDWNDFLNLKGDYGKMKPFSNYPRALIRYG